VIQSLDLCPPSVVSRNVVSQVWSRLVLLVITAVLISAVAFPLQAQHGNKTAGTGLTMVSFTLSSPAVTIGQTLSGTVTYKNTGSSSITINQVVITARPPGGTNSAGPYDNFSPTLSLTTIQAGATVTLTGSWTFSSTAPTGTWYSFATYQDSSSVWHDGSSIVFTVSASTAVSQAPVVSAGASQTVTLPACATLSGTASDPSGLALTTTWSMSSGPAAVTFGNANALSTTACFSTAGTYVLQLSASDGKLTSTSSVTITVNADPNAINAPSNLTGTANKGAAKLAWTDNATNEAGFYVERALSGSAGFVRIATLAANVKTYTDPVGRGNYAYRVQAFNGSAVSAYSNTATVRVK